MSLLATGIAAAIGLGTKAASNAKRNRLRDDWQANYDTEKALLDSAITRNQGANYYANNFNAYDPLAYQLSPNSELYPFGGMRNTNCDPKITGGKGGCGMPRQMLDGLGLDITKDIPIGTGLTTGRKGNRRGGRRGVNVNIEKDTGMGATIIKEFFEGMGKSIGADLVDKKTKGSKTFPLGGVSKWYSGLDNFGKGSLNMGIGTGLFNLMDMAFMNNPQDVDFSEQIGSLDANSGNVMRQAQRDAGVYGVGGVNPDIPFSSTGNLGTNAVGANGTPNGIADLNLLASMGAPVIVDDQAIMKAYLDGSLQKANDSMGVLNSYGTGGVKPTSTNTGMVVAGSHESGKDLELDGGGKSSFVEGGEVIKEGANAQLIFSDRIPIPGTNAMFADVANALSVKKGEYEKETNTPNSIKNNTNTRNSMQMDSKLNKLFMLQEVVKKVMGLDDVQIESNNPNANGGNDVNALGDVNYPYPNFDNRKYDKSLINDAIILDEPQSNGINNKSVVTNPNISTNTTNGNVTFKDWYGRDPLKARNYIGSGISMLDNVWNMKVLRDMTNPDNYLRASDEEINPMYAQARDLKTDYDVDPQLAAIDSELAKFRDMLGSEVSSSQQRIANSRAGMSDAIKGKNEVYDTKNKTEIDLYNKDQMNKQQVDQFNAQMNLQAEQANANLRASDVNMLNDLQFKRGAMGSANAANLVDDFQNFLTRDVYNETAKRQMAAMSGLTNDTGVDINRIKQGDYNSLNPNQMSLIFDNMIKSGNLSWEDYVKGIDAYNKVRGNKGVTQYDKQTFDVMSRK